MLLVEFPVNLHSGDNLVKYRSTDNGDWYYIYMDLETLNLFILGVRHYYLQGSWASAML